MPQIALTAHSQILVLAHTFAVIQHHQTQVMLISIEIFPVIIEKKRLFYRYKYTTHCFYIN